MDNIKKVIMNKIAIFKKGVRELLVATIALVGCSKNDNTTPNPVPDSPKETAPYIQLTTAREKGSQIQLTIEAPKADKKDIWIDLNNNGVYDNGIDVRLSAATAKYTLKGSTLRVYGKLTLFNCSYNEVTSLEVTHHPLLERLDMSHNKIKEIDLSKNTALTYLKVSDLPLTGLDLRANKKLKELRFNRTLSGEKLKRCVNTLHENGGGTIYMHKSITDSEKERATMQILKKKKWNIGNCE